MWGRYWGNHYWGRYWGNGAMITPPISIFDPMKTFNGSLSIFESSNRTVLMRSMIAASVSIKSKD